AAAAAALADRADQLGDGDRALAVRTRAAALFLDLADDPAQAAALIEAVLSAKPGASEAQELLRAAHLRLGHSAPMELPRAPEADDSADAAVRGAGDDAFARLVREAEVCLDQLGDPVRALELYDRALTQRGDDDRSWPLVREGVTRAAAAAGASERLRGLAERARARAGTGGPALAWAYLALAEVAAEAEAQSHYLAARAADSDRGPAWAMAERALERDHIGAGRWQALWDLYTEVADLPALSAQAPREALATRLERARLAERLERPDDDIQACYRDALGLDEGCLPALFRVYHESRRSDSAALAAAGVDPAAIASAVAAYMHARGGATTEAALLTRGGETLLAAGQLEDAIERFRQADMAAGGDASEPGGAELGRGYSAAHYGWRVAALRGQLWDDAAEAALRESRLPEAADERAELAHLAGVILMDKALHGEQALPALEAALEAAPDDDDTFARLNVLLDEQGEHERQAELLRARLARERDPGVKARLHLDLAELARNFLDDRAGAGDHLRALLALRPGDRDAITTLADLAWEQGDWAAAAEHLIARARVETDPALRKTLFFRLGTIYADRLPEPALAIKSFKQVLRQDKDDEGALAGLARVALASGDAKLALAAAERLVRLARSDDARVERLHRVAAIYRDGLDDPARAERAYRLALDRAPTNDAALAALIGFYEDRGDTRSIRVHLDRVIGAMRLRLDDDSADGVAYRVIARAMRARHRAGVGGSLAPARCAAELALALDAGDADERGLAAETVRGLVGLDQPGGDDLLRPQAVPPAARQLFAALGDRLAKHIGADLRRHGVSRGQRVRDPGAAAVMACEAVAGELGVEPPAVYLSEARPQAFALEPTSPPSIILGAELMAAMGPDELRFVTGRALGLERGGVLAPVSLDEDAFAVFLAALLRQFDPEFELPGIAAAAVEEEAQRLRRVVSAGLVQELLPVALGVMGAGLDPAALRAGLLETGDRVGLLACGSVAAAARWLGRVHGHDGVAAALGDPEVAALVRFAVGPDHAALRGLMQR
ncbi:hypothetical protein, partial [Haliangium sp.]|uniref:hypothetical protein n=1 Tax=Haliangium sp. TaxID=2663208 RepID=UPI003D0DB5F9